MKYQPGEIVDIVIRGARVLNCDGGSLVYEYREGARTDREEVQHEFSAVEITRLVPAEGPPKAGELWEDAHGVRYLATEYAGGIRLHSGAPGGTGYEVAFLHHHYGPIKRVLAARDDELGSEEITPTIAHHVLWHYGEPGMEPGSFTKDLIALIARADPHNRRRLAAEYPGYVAACNRAEATDTGIANLRQIAERAT
jgi:hypothetical protein